MGETLTTDELSISVPQPAVPADRLPVRPGVLALAQVLDPRVPQWVGRVDDARTVADDPDTLGDRRYLDVVAVDPLTVERAHAHRVNLSRRSISSIMPCPISLLITVVYTFQSLSTMALT